MRQNKILEKLPRHLQQYCIEQPYDEYTWQDHAVWRFVMRQNVDYLKDNAHETYLNGLRKTGISIEKIPDLATMNCILNKIGWAAVTVDGFIPPAAFMEFQAHKVLVIAADIRPIDQIGYTPAPDIIHEAAGHAPIIADDNYAEYLRYFGEIGSKAISSAKDYVLYEAIRHLSILKADPYTPEQEIRDAEEQLKRLDTQMGLPSEMALIRNLHWWTVEYGLIGELASPRIYGAGLLSSIAESKGALQPEVQKLPYSPEAIHYNFDITKPQPQLFVTPDFQYLITVLDEFANTMAFRKGGIEGILKAVDSGNIASIRFSSGLQLTGVVSEYIRKQNEVIFVKTSGPSALSYAERQLEGHGKTVHHHGYSTPVGKLRGFNKPPRLISTEELQKKGIVPGKMSTLKFVSGLTVKGRLRSETRKDENLLLLSFNECTVEYEGRILFQPDWGVFDMAIGEAVVSVMNGPVDPDAFGGLTEPPKEHTHKLQRTKKEEVLFTQYGVIRQIREGKLDQVLIPEIWKNIHTNYPEDWLLPLEILEILQNTDHQPTIKSEIVEHLYHIQQKNPTLTTTLQRGLKLISLE